MSQPSFEQSTPRIPVPPRKPAHKRPTSAAGKADMETVIFRAMKIYCGVLGYDTVLSGRWVSTFQRNTLSPSSSKQYVPATVWHPPTGYQRPQRNAPTLTAPLDARLCLTVLRRDRTSSELPETSSKSHRRTRYSFLHATA